MKVSVDQYCINVSDLDKSVHFYETTLGLTITHRVEEKEFREVILAGESGNRIRSPTARTARSSTATASGSSTCRPTTARGSTNDASMPAPSP